MSPDSTPVPEPPVCPNCEAPLAGPHCSSCGQRQLDLDRPFREILREAMDSFLAFDARILRTLWPMISKPGWLTLEFVAGRRARYVHPFKIYFAMSVLLFLTLTLSGYSMITVSDRGNGAVAPVTVGTPDGTPPVEEPDDTSGEENLLGRSLQRLGELHEEVPKRLDRVFNDRLAKSIFVLVPVFAALLRLLYRRTRYVAHLVFSLYLHSFAFLVILLGLLLDLALGAADGEGPGNPISTLVIVVYTFIALRRVHGQGRFLTLGKMVVLMVGYLVALLVTMILTLAVTLATI